MLKQKRFSSQIRTRTYNKVSTYLVSADTTNGYSAPLALPLVTAVFAGFVSQG